MTWTVTATAALLLGVTLAAQAQTDSAGTMAVAEAVNVAPVPFGPGERVTYRASWGPMRGSASSEVAIDTVRGRPVYHLSFHVRGGMLGLNVNDHQESWLDVGQLYSHRFKQNLNQPRYKRLRTLDFFPAERVWRMKEAPQPSGPLASDRPLDDVSFLYWARTLPLEVGRTYEFNRYYKESGNPVRVQVLRRETVRVRAGTFNTIVVRPYIQTSGLFAEAEGAEIYFSDDDARLVVMMKTKVAIGTMTLELETYTPGRRLASSRP